MAFDTFLRHIHTLSKHVGSSTLVLYIYHFESPTPSHSFATFWHFSTLCSKGKRAFFNVFIFLSVNIDRVHNYLVTTSRISDIIKIWFTSHNRSYWLFTNYQIWNLKKLVKTKSTKENQRKDAFSNNCIYSGTKSIDIDMMIMKDTDPMKIFSQSVILQVLLQ